MVTQNQTFWDIAIRKGSLGTWGKWVCFFFFFFFCSFFSSSIHAVLFVYLSRRFIVLFKSFSNWNELWINLKISIFHQHFSRLNVILGVKYQYPPPPPPSPPPPPHTHTHNTPVHWWRNSGPSCSKLTTSLVNDSLKFRSSDTQICWIFLLKKCE